MRRRDKSPREAGGPGPQPGARPKRVGRAGGQTGSRAGAAARSDGGPGSDRDDGPGGEAARRVPAGRMARGLWIAAALALIALAGLGAYAGSRHGTFIFDDFFSIAGNGSIRSFASALHPPHGGGRTVEGRPVLNLSFALNYALGGTAVEGYHVLNVGIHILAALLLFGIVRRTARRNAGLFWGQSGDPSGSRAIVLAAATGLVWVVHPLNTEAVTYVVQRAESLMGLFFLLSIYGFVRAADAGKPGSLAWKALSVGACLLGMGTKEVTVTLPIMILVFDRTFVAGGFAAAVRRRAGYYAALASTWAWLAVLVVGTGGNRGGSIGFGTAVSWGGYLLTQAEAIVRYLGLAFWPHPLIFEYGSLLGRTAASFAPFVAPVLLLGILSLVALWRRPALGFAGFWFFGILAPTSLTPGTTQMIVEHRMYLPLIALVVLVSWALVRLCLWRGFAAPAAAAVVLPLAAALALATARRNEDYASELRLWSDTVAKRPESMIARDNVGVALMSEGRVPEAIEALQEAVKVDPSFAVARSDLGIALSKAGRYPESIQQLSEARRLEPNDAPIRTNLGNVLMDVGRSDEAIAEYTRAVELRPDLEQVVLNLGNAYLRVGRVAEAVPYVKRALALDPDNASAHATLGAALIQSGRKEEGVEELRKAVALNPNDAGLQNNLGTGLAMSGRTREAAEHFAAALRIDPANEQARTNYELTRGKAGSPSAPAVR